MVGSEEAPSSSAPLPDIGWRPTTGSVAPGIVRRCSQCGWVGVTVEHQTCGRPGAGSLCGAPYESNLSIWLGSVDKAKEDPQWQEKFEVAGRPVLWLPHKRLYGSYTHCYGCYPEVTKARERALLLASEGGYFSDNM